MENERTNMDVKAMLNEARKENGVETPSDPATHIVGQNWAEGLKAESSQPVETQEESAPAQEVVPAVEETIEEEVTPVETVETTEETEEEPTPVETVEATPEEVEEAPVAEQSAPRIISRENVQSGNGGMIVNNSEMKEASVDPQVGDLSPALKKDIEKYMNEMDDDTEELKKFKEAIFAALEAKGVNTKDDAAVKVARIELLKNGVNIGDPEAIKNCKVDLTHLNTDWVDKGNIDDTTLEDNYKNYNEAVVVIDKIGMGSAIGFTPEEREKLQKANVIKLKEVEEVSLDAITIKKPKEKTGIKDILRRGRNPFSTNIVAVASGYTATIRGGSSYEITAILREVTNAVMDTEAKWQLIYDKIESMSCGKPKEFTDWLKMTAASDYDIFIYGILVATYPEDDEITFNCNTPSCREEHFEFTHKYTVRSLLRAERMSDKMKEYVKNAIDNGMTKMQSLAYIRSGAPINNIKRIKLPVSSAIVEFKIQTAYELIYSSIEELHDDNIDAKYADTAALSTSIARMFSPDIESGLNETGNYDYFEIDSPLEITEALYTFSDKDRLIVSTYARDMFADVSFDFGLMNIVCPKCHAVTEYHEMDVERILFRKLQQAEATMIE